MNSIENTSKSLRYLVALLLLTSGSACNRADDDGDSTPVVIGDPPAVSAVTPLANTIGLPINTKIVTATFTKPINSSTLTPESFALNCPAGTLITGSVSYDDVGHVATLTLPAASNLPPSAVCTATLGTGIKDTSGIALASAHAWNFSTGLTTDTTAPAVIGTSHANGAVNVALNSAIGATFSEGMNPLSLTAATYLLKESSSGNAVAGTVSYSGLDAVFTPSHRLSPGIGYTVTIKGGASGAKDLAGNPLINDHVITWTTAAATDTEAPTVTATNPADTAMDVCINKAINFTFSEPMDPLSVTSATFTLATRFGAAVSGLVSYDALSNIATFTPATNIAGNTSYTATIKGGSGGVRDLAGNTLISDALSHFTTSAMACTIAATAPSLGAAASFGSFGGGAGMTNQGIFTIINGDIGTTGVSTTMTGFHDAAGDIYTETPLNIGTVNGRIYTAPPAPGGAAAGGTAASFTIASAAANAALIAYNSMSPASLPGGVDAGAGQLGGLTLQPGIYKAASGSFLLTGADLTLDAQGDANAVWIFQTASSLTVGAPGFPRQVLLTNGAQARNVFWHVGSAARIEDGSSMVGSIIAYAGVTISTGGQTTLTRLNGRALGLNASVTVVNTIINLPK